MSEQMITLVKMKMLLHWLTSILGGENVHEENIAESLNLDAKKSSICEVFKCLTDQEITKKARENKNKVTVKKASSKCRSGWQTKQVSSMLTAFRRSRWRHKSK